ncbi:MAG TPA: ATP synthase F0 subunit B [Blastocatellia bacterium]
MIPALVSLNLSPVLLADTPPADHTLWQVINLVIFVAGLAYIFINKVKIGQVFDKRAAAIKRNLDEARKEQLEAQKHLAEIAARLARLDQEVAGIKDQAEREARREAERIKQAAEADAEKMAQLAKREIEGAARSARAELRAFTAEQSVGLAESLIRKHIKPQDNTRIVSQYVDELGAIKEVNP